MLNGQIVWKKEPCDECGKQTKHTNKYGEPKFFYYVYNDKKLCRACARKHNVI